MVRTGRQRPRQLRTALVTGASTGLGAEFARQVAARGCGLVLVARREKAMRELAEELAGRFGAAVEVLPADLADPDQLAEVERRLADPERPPVDLLVNNAGVGGSGPAVEASADDQERQVRINVLAPVRLTRAALPGMLERGSGALVNVASMAGAVPATPGAALYGAGKAMLRSWSAGLAVELRGTGVRVVAVSPGYVRTEMTRGLQRTNPPKLIWTPPEKVVGTALRALATGRTSVVPGLQYKAGAAAVRLLPDQVLLRAIGRVRM